METALTVLSLLVAIGSLLWAVYERAVINESKKRRNELQFLLAAVHQLATAEQAEWHNQIGLLPPPTDERDRQILRIHFRARDSMFGIASAITALEGAIDVRSSAIVAMLEKSLQQRNLVNRLQAEAMQNPPSAPAQSSEEPPREPM